MSNYKPENPVDAFLYAVSSGYKKSVEEQQKAEQESREAARASERAQVRASQTRRASKERQALAQERLDKQVEVTRYTDEERARLGITEDTLDVLYSAERDLTEQELVHTLEAIKTERGITSSLPWMQIGLGALLLGGIGFGVHKFRQKGGQAQSKRRPQRQTQKTL